MRLGTLRPYRPDFGQGPHEPNRVASPKAEMEIEGTRNRQGEGHFVPPRSKCFRHKLID